MQTNAVKQIGAPAPDTVWLRSRLAGIAGGDRQALAELYAAARGAVYAAALGILKNAHDAQDVTQDAFVRIWENAGRYEPTGSPMAWMLSVTRNLALMRLRQSSRTAELSEGEWDAIPIAAPAVTPEDRIVLQTALAALSDTERQIVLLHAASGLKHREIAALLDIPLPTVLSKYHRAMKKMRARMEGDEAL